MKGKKSSLPTIKKPRAWTNRRAVFCTVKILAAVAAAGNLVLLFGFNYWLSDLPSAAANPPALELSSEKDTEAPSSELTASAETDSEITDEAEAPKETKAALKTEKPPETEFQAETKETEIQTETELQAETEAQAETEPVSETPKSTAPKKTKPAKEKSGSKNASHDYTGPSIALTGELPQITAEAMENLPVILAESKILTVDDGYGKDISSQVIPSYQMDTGSIGIMKANFSLTNGKGDSAELDFTFRPSLTEPLMLLTKDHVTLKKGETFNYLNYIAAAMDTNGYSLSHSIRISGTVDSQTPGTYEVYYRITGTSSGKTGEAMLTVTVAKN